MSMIRDFFDMNLFINLERRTDRRENISIQAEKIGLRENVFPAFDGKELLTRPGKPPYEGWTTISMGNYANVLSQRKVLTMGIESGSDSLLILEDDVDFVGSIEEIDAYLENVPDNWDMIYFGGNHQQPLIPIDNKIGRCQFTLTAHAVGFRRTVFDHIVHFTRNADRPIDLYYAMLHKQYNVYCPLKGLATQLNGYSDIESKEVNYTNIIH